MGGSRAEYEAAVQGIADLVFIRLGAGEDSQTVARDAVELRNLLKVRFRKGLPRAVIAEMERRNFDKYGHPIGPTPEWLFEKYGNWEAVARASARTANLRKRM